MLIILGIELDEDVRKLLVLAIIFLINISRLQQVSDQ
jgi:hypothetical protein